MESNTNTPSPLQVQGIHRGKDVAVLMGGPGPESEISRWSGQAVADALRERGYAARTVEVDQNLDQVLRNNRPDVAVIALHGVGGEDGTVQGLLEYLGIPYTGSNVLSSALAMDKVKSKELFRLYNIPTLPYYTVESEQMAQLERVHGTFGFPVFVKPAGGGSSLGSGKADTVSELQARCEEALQYDTTVLVERYVEGKEINVGVVRGEAIGAIEIEPQREFYDYVAKYGEDQSTYHFPARVAPTRYQGLLRLAERANLALGATGITRVDMLVTAGENEYVLELNTIPGFTAKSLIPKMGISFLDLCEIMVDDARLHALSPQRLGMSDKRRGQGLLPPSDRGAHNTDMGGSKGSAESQGHGPTGSSTGGARAQQGGGSPGSTRSAQVQTIRTQNAQPAAHP